MSFIWFYFGYIAFIFQTHSSLGILNTSANANEVNVALNKPTHQSSPVNSLTSLLVVDGKKNVGSGCSRTAKEMRPWWSVDLQEVFKIKSVRIYFSKKFFISHFIWPLSVYIHMKSKGRIIICHHDIHSFVHGFLLADCQGEIGQFVTVQLLEKNAILELCEVEVIGEKSFPTGIISRHYCRSTGKPTQVIGAFSARSRTECAVLCTQTEKCDAFSFKTKSGQTSLCQLKQVTSNVLTKNKMEDYNSC